MTDFVKITDYAAKDALLTGNPAKLVKGVEIGADFDAVAVAVATKHDAADIGVTVQAYSANLDEYAAVNPTAAGLAILDDATASDQLTTLGVSAFAKTILDDADEATFKATVNLEIGTDVQAYDVDTAKLDVDQTWTGAQRGAITALTDAATIALDLSTGNNFVVQLGGNRTLGMPTSVVANQSGTITVLQDKTGSRTLAYAWPYVWAGGTAGTLSTPGGTEDQLVYEVRSYNSATMTVTIATPGVVTMTSHGFYHGQRIKITTTGALPTGLTASTTYFVEVIDANSFYLCTTLANVAAGTRIATSGSQSGTHTLTGCTIRLALNKAWA